MNETQQRPKIGFWAAVAVAMLLAYPVSFGPACWIDASAGLVQGTASRAYRAVFSTVYQPLIWIATKNARAEAVILWYARLGVTSGRTPFISNKEVRWSGSFADFSELIHLIQSTVEPETGDLTEMPTADSEIVVDSEAE